MSTTNIKQFLDSLSNVEKKEVSELLFNSLPEEEKQRFSTAITGFLNQRTVLKIAHQMPPVEQMAIILAWWARFSTSEWFIQKVENEPEFQSIFQLFRQSKEKGKIEPAILQEYKTRIASITQDLISKRERIREDILGEQIENYQKLQQNARHNKDELCQEIFKKCKEKDFNQDNSKKYDSINMMIYALQANTIAQLLQMSLEKMLYLDFRDEEGNKTDMLKYYAFAIYQPQHALMLEYFDDDWENFPLRWCIAHLPIPLVKTLFSMFKEGKNISEYFIISFQGDGVDRIIKLLSNPLLYYRFYKLSQIKKSIIEEAIDCYKQKKYAATISTILPIIEKILWDYSVYIDSLGNRIYKSGTSGTDAKILIDKNGIEIKKKKPTIGDLLQHTVLEDFLDLKFIDYFCNELYRERNEILHGNADDFATELNAAKKLATIEYLLITINNHLARDLSEYLEKEVPSEILEGTFDVLNQLLSV